MATGKVKRWVDERGFGFLRPDNGDAVIFCHVTALQGAKIDRLVEGERVSYEIGVNARTGKPMAVDVQLI